MIFKILSSTLFLPFLVVGMIIAQVHLEGYWNANSTRWRGKRLSVFYIIFVYIVQEICIMELTLLNIDTMAFTYVIPLTMILRNRHKLWWYLYAITPLIAWSLDLYLERYQYFNIWTDLLRLVSLGLICWILLQFKNLSYYIRYSIVIYGSCLTHIVQLHIDRQLNPDFIVSLLLGNLFIILAENSRMYYEQEQKEQLARLRYESVRDDLTGLLNYRAFDQDMKVLPQEEDMPIFIAVLDIDHFKNVNDTYGHLNGNIVLSTFSKRLKHDIHQNFDPHCAVYRFGGEEFTIIARAKDNTEILDVLNDIDKYFSTHPVITSEGQKITFTFSGGLTMHKKDEKFTQALERADNLVYQAKNSGRAKILVG